MLNVRLFQSLKVKVLSCFKGKGQGEQKERKQTSLRRGYRCDILVTEIDERAVVVLVLTHASVLDGQNHLPLCNVANFFSSLTFHALTTNLPLCNVVMCPCNFFIDVDSNRSLDVSRLDTESTTVHLL